MVFLFGLLAALLLATGYVLQQHEAADIPDAKLSPKLLIRLTRRPIWVGGIFAMIGGQLLGATALGLGSLVIVEPLLALNVLFALPLAAVSSRRHLSAGDWVGALMLIAGLALFLVGAGQDADVSQGSPTGPVWVLAGCGLIGLLVVVLFAARGRHRRVQAALLATGAGAIFGMQDFLTQRTLVRLDDGGVGHMLASWLPYALFTAAVAGLTFSQRAFGLADLSASLPPITLAEPVCGIALSIFALGQGFPASPAHLVLAGAGLALMVAGVAVLTRSPLVVDPHGKKRTHHLHLPRLPEHHPSR